MFRPRNKYALLIYIGAVLCIIAWAAVSRFADVNSYVTSGSGETAEIRMADAIRVIRSQREAAGVNIDISDDPNNTGLIGPRRGALATTLGNPAAKRTTTNPQIAGLILNLLIEAGVREGDAVAISASASFPALMIASVVAAEAIGAAPLLMVSLGASSYGLTDPDFNMLDLCRLLRREGIFSHDLTGISLGGERDMGDEFSDSLRKALITGIRRDGLPFIHDADLGNNVSTRMQMVRKAAEDRRIAAFINCGGSYYNLGTHAQILTVEPGLNLSLKLPPLEHRGMLYEMASHNIPVIHLLNIRDLVRNHGIEWDPVLNID